MIYVVGSERTREQILRIAAESQFDVRVELLDTIINEALRGATPAARPPFRWTHSLAAPPQTARVCIREGRSFAGHRGQDDG